MPKLKKESFDITGLDKLPIIKEQLSLKMLLDRVIIDSNPRKIRSLEQRIIAVKILTLNDMNYAITCRQVGVNRRTLNTWWQKYGEMMHIVEPEYAIAEALENDLSLLIQDAYGSARKSIKKLDTLVDQIRTPKQINAVVEALKCVTEILKLEKATAPPDEGGSFFKDLLSVAVQNAKEESKIDIEGIVRNA